MAGATSSREARVIAAMRATPLSVDAYPALRDPPHEPITGFSHAWRASEPGRRPTRRGTSFNRHTVARPVRGAVGTPRGDHFRHSWPYLAQPRSHGASREAAQMLSIGKLAGGGEEYYLEAVAAGVEDYYLGAGEAPGLWLAGAAALGLEGEVAADDLRAVLEGRAPDGEQLAVAPPGRPRVPGFDLTFSAPKSVSILHALGSPAVQSEAVAAHEEAVAAALRLPGASRRVPSARRRRARAGPGAGPGGRGLPPSPEPRSGPGPPHPRAGRQPGPRRRRALRRPRRSSSLPPRHDGRPPVPGRASPPAQPAPRSGVAPGAPRPGRDRGVPGRGASCLQPPPGPD